MESVGFRAFGSDVLFVARKRRIESTGKPERAEDKRALAVGDVVHDLTNAPLLRSVTIQGSLRGDRREDGLDLVELRIHDGLRIVALHQIDVGEVVRGGFGGLGATDHRCKATAVGRTAQTRAVP